MVPCITPNVSSLVPYSYGMIDWTETRLCYQRMIYWTKTRLCYQGISVGSGFSKRVIPIFLFFKLLLFVRYHDLHALTHGGVIYSSLLSPRIVPSSFWRLPCSLMMLFPQFKNEFLQLSSWSIN